MDLSKIKMPSAGTVHPILKQKSSSKITAAAPSTNNDDGNKELDKSKHLTWDEHAIEEHDLLRGTRMKIDEPDTPYTHYEHHSDDESTSSARQPRSPDETQPNHEKNSLASQWGDISSKLQAVADKRDACPLSPAISRDSNMSGGEEEEGERKKKFKDMRKKHYNEAEMMRKWREAHANMDDEEDDDEDDEEEDVKMKE